MDKKKNNTPKNAVVRISEQITDFALSHRTMRYQANKSNDKS